MFKKLFKFVLELCGVQDYIAKTFVSSENIKAIWYKKHDLFVQFHYENAVYTYLDVPFNLAKDLLHADSHGKYLNQYIKDNYKYERIA